MNRTDSFSKISMGHKLFYYKLFIIVGLLIAPVIGLLYFAMKHNLFSDTYFIPFLAIFLALFCIGFILFQKIANHLKNSSANMAQTMPGAEQSDIGAKPNEPQNAVHSLQKLENELKTKTFYLDKLTAEIQTLKELSDISYMTLNADYLLFIALERALKLVDADIGSVMILSRPQKDAFVIKASIGLTDHGKKGTITPFEDSVAKYVVINKAPLLVRDIENDSRFGRPARGRYSTKSFICMPLKTGNEVIGVMTLSRRRSDTVFSQTDVDLLAPLLSNAAYIYDNINLFQEMRDMSRSLTSVRAISRTINSSLKGAEVVQMIFEQMRKNLMFDAILLLSVHPGSPLTLTLIDFKSYISTTLSRGKTIMLENTVLEQAIQERRALYVRDVQELNCPIDIKLFKQKEVETVLILPLEMEGEITNLLLVFNLPEQDWNRQEDYIDIMGDQLSLAMENERLLESLDKRDRMLESLSLVYSTLKLPTFDINTAMTQAMDMLRTVLPVEAGYLLLPEDGGLSFAAAFNLDMQKLQMFKIPITQSIAGQVFEEGETVIANEASKHPQFCRLFDEETGFNTRSLLSVPLISKGQITGVIEVLNKMDGDFTEADARMIESIAANAGIAMENVRRYSKGFTPLEKRPLDVPHTSFTTM